MTAAATVIRVGSAIGPVIGEFERLANAASPGPWHWWTSNSWRRLGTMERDGNVLHPFVVHHDGHPNLAISEEDMAFIAAARDAVPLLCRVIRRLERELEAESSRMATLTTNAKAWRDQAEEAKEARRAVEEKNRELTRQLKAAERRASLKRTR